MSEVQLTLDETMQKIEERMNENPAPIEGLQLIYQFEITGKEEGTYQLCLQDGRANIVQGNPRHSDCTMKMSFKNFYKFLLGSIGGTAAFMTGKLKIEGDITKALKLESLLKHYDFK
ncbi:SCP2 sterol-binding domain-containing protein [Oceanobacillus sp. FSL H7-0719]|uniref:SCP2 sterol-binding domain-containing protein n=1 Tax=Oceanobacillus sp. FSL H7-0719 TaxID=2954507 RepID=UPI00324C2D31